MKATFYFLRHGIKEPLIIEYDNVESEYHLTNMMAMGLVVGNEDGTFNDKIFAYWNGVWYHTAVGPSEDDEDDDMEESE